MTPKYFAFDVETTGLNHERCAIVSLAYVILDDQFNALDYDELYAYPFEDAVIDSKAIEINGYSKEKWDKLGAISQEDLCDKVDNLFMKYTHRLMPLGYNVQFDLKFLKQLFERNNAIFHCHFTEESLCVMKEVKMMDQSNEYVEPDGYRLANMCKRFDVENDNPHQAMSDIQATIDVYKRIREEMK